MKTVPPVHRIALLFNGSKIYDRGIISGIGNYLSSTRASWDLFLEEDFLCRLKGIERWQGDGIIADFDDPLIGEMVGDKLKYYPTTTREDFHHMGRVTDNLLSGKVFADLGLPAMNPAEDRAMVCGSLAFNVDVKAILEGFGLREGANSDPKEFVVEKAFVGDGI